MTLKRLRWKAFIKLRFIVLLTLLFALVYIIYQVFHTSGAVVVKSSSRNFAEYILGASGSKSVNYNAVKFNKIPKIIHQTWKSQGELPETFRPWISSWLKLNDDWEYWFWTDESMKAFIQEVFPNYFALYISYPTQGYRADAFRYFVLYEYGGLYVDLDMECLKPLNPIIEQHVCILSQEPVEHAYFLSDISPPLVSNALMACRPNHPFFADVISRLKGNVGIFQWNDILHATGPLMLTRLYHELMVTSAQRYDDSSLSVKDDINRVHIVDADMFQPAADSSMVDHMRDKCTAAAATRNSLSGHFSNADELRLLCEKLTVHDFGRSVYTKSYSVHHWTHTWAGRAVDPWGLTDMRTRFHVSELQGSRSALNVSAVWH